MTAPVPGIVGPGMSVGDAKVQIPLPDCVRLQTDADRKAFSDFVQAVVTSTRRHCVAQINDLARRLEV